MSAKLTINGRYLTRPITGVERFAREIQKRLHTEHQIAAPPTRFANGALGHAWEQTALARRPGLLWSPCNTGPIAHRRHVVTIHDVAPLIHPEWFNPNFVRLYNRLTPALCKNAALVVTDLACRADELRSLGVGDERLRVIPLGVAPEFCPAGPEEIASLRTRLGIGDRSYVLALASDDPRKNVDRLLMAWGQLGPVQENRTLVLAGGTNEKIFAGTDRPATDGVLRIGRVSDQDLPALLSGADLFVSVSLYEGFGLPPLEALACGTNVVVSSIDAHQETMAGLSVRFVDPADTADIAGGIAHVLGSEQRKNLAGVRDKFDWLRSSAAYDSLFDSVSN